MVPGPGLRLMRQEARPARSSGSDVLAPGAQITSTVTWAGLKFPKPSVTQYWK